MSTTLAIPESAQRAYEVAERRGANLAQLELDLGLPEGSTKITGLRQEALEPLTYEQWTEAGHKLSFARQWATWCIGDWFVAGSQFFTDEQVEQAVEGHAAERMDVANRITGLDPQTIQNYASVCRKVPLEVRRAELSFGHHQAVQALDQEEQVYWLDQAVQNGWDRAALRDEIRASKAGGAGDGQTQVVEPRKSKSERLMEIIEAVANMGQPTSDGGAFVPAEAWHQVLAATGRE